MYQSNLCYYSYNLCEKLQSLASSKCLPQLKIVSKDLLLTLLTLGLSFCGNLYRLFINFILTDNASALHVLCKKPKFCESEPTALFLRKCLQSQMRVHGKLSSLFFALKNQFKGNTL